MMKNRKLGLPAGLILGLIGTVAEATEIPTNAALMQAMDKVTGRVKEITVPVNSKITYGDFSLVLRSCKKRPAEETPENFAFIDVADKSFGSEEYNIFRGWIISSTPGISAIEHPIYDIWLLECTDLEKIDETQLLSKEELDQRDLLPQKEKIVDSKKEIIAEKEKDENKDEKVIHIKEFINEDRDIEKNIKNTPTYISESNKAYISDIEEGSEPENLLLFTKMQEVDSKSKKMQEDNDLNKTIEDELLKLREN